MTFEVFDMLTGNALGTLRGMRGWKAAREIARALYGVHVDVCEAR